MVNYVMTTLRTKTNLKSSSTCNRFSLINLFFAFLFLIYPLNKFYFQEEESLGFDNSDPAG